MRVWVRKLTICLFKTVHQFAVLQLYILQYNKKEGDVTHFKQVCLVEKCITVYKLLDFNYKAGNVQSQV